MKNRIGIVTDRDDVSSRQLDHEAGKTKTYWFVVTVVAVLAVIVTVAVLFGLHEAYVGGNKPIANQNNTETKYPASIHASPFRGGTFEASGVAFVPGSDQVLFVDDGNSSEILSMRLDSEGDQIDEINRLPLGVKIDDPEDITFDGSYFYIVSSQSKLKSGEQTGIVRFSYDPAQHLIRSTAISGLREFLFDHVPELAAERSRKGSEGGLNIEGIAWDPKQERLLLGLRSPLVNNQAVIIPLKLRDPKATFSIENLVIPEPHMITLMLDGLGIRSIEYDTTLRTFLIIAGAMEGQQKSEFSLWRWNGSDTPRKTKLLDPKIKPEGITRASVGGNEFLFVVADAGYYFHMNNFE